MARPAQQRPDAPSQATQGTDLGRYEVEFVGRVIERGLGGRADLPVAGARVMAYAPPPAHCGNGAFSDANGRYTLRCSGMTAGLQVSEVDVSWTVFAADTIASLEAPDVSRVTYRDLGHQIERDVVLHASGPEPSPTPADSADGLVEGRIVDAASGRGVGGARVRIVAPPRCDRAAVSDMDSGAFAILCGVGTIESLVLEVEAPGHELLTFEQPASPSSPTNDIGDNLLLGLTPNGASVIDADADTWVTYVSPPTGATVLDTPHGDEPRLNAGLWDTGDNMEALIRFARPEGGLPGQLRRAELWFTVDAATSVSHAPNASRDAASLAFRPALAAWDEATVLGKDRPAVGMVDATAETTAGLQRLEFTVPARAWLNGLRPNGWSVRAGSVAEGGTMGVTVRLDSRETVFGPKLVLYMSRDDATSTVPPPAHATASPGATPPTTPTSIPPRTPQAVIGGGMRMLGHTLGRARDVGIASGHAVLAQDGDLVIFDVRAPASPVEVGRLPLGLAVHRVLVRGDRAYVTGDGALWVVDIENPAQPTVVGTAAIDAMAVDLAFTNDRLFVLENWPSLALRVFDVADPTSPQVLGTAPGAYEDIDADDGIVVAVRFNEPNSNATEADVFLASDLPDAAIVAHLVDDSLGEISDVAVAGDSAYLLSEYRSRLAIFDLADPLRPVRVARLTLPWPFTNTALRAHGSTLVVATPWHVGVIDAADPTQAVVRAQDGVDVDPWSGLAHWIGIGIEGRTIAHASSATGLAIVELRDDGPVLVAQVVTSRPVIPVDIAVAGSDVVVADLPDEVIRVDVSDIAAPVVADGRISPIDDEQVQAVAVANDRVFALFRKAFQPVRSTIAELDRGRPGLPVLASMAMPLTGSHALAVVGDRAYVATYERGLLVIDVPSGGPFVERGSFGSFGSTVLVDLAVSGPFAYLLDYTKGLVIVDVSDPDAPRSVGEVALPGQPRRLALAGSYVFFTGWDDAAVERLGVIDVTDATAPKLLPPIDLFGGAMEIDPSQRCLFISDPTALRMYDIERPAAPRLLDSLPRLTFAAMAADDQRLFGANAELGVVSIRYHCSERLPAGMRALLPFGLRSDR